MKNPLLTKRPQYASVVGLPEEAQIRAIVDAAKGGKKVAFVVDTSDVADRWVEAIRRLCPALRVLDRFHGPTAGVYTVKVGL